MTRDGAYKNFKMPLFPNLVNSFDFKMGTKLRKLNEER